MTPDAHGYVRCGRCGCWRPAPDVMREAGAPRCADVAVCGRLAGVGDGRIDADTGCDANGSPAR